MAIIKNMNPIKKRLGEKIRVEDHNRLADKIRDYKRMVKGVRSSDEDSFYRLSCYIRNFEEERGKEHYESDLFNLIKDIDLNLQTEADAKINSDLYRTLSLGDPFAIKKLLERQKDGAFEVRVKASDDEGFWDANQFVELEGVKIPFCRSDQYENMPYNMDLVCCGNHQIRGLNYSTYSGRLLFGMDMDKPPWLDILVEDKDNSEVAVKEALAFVEEALETINRLQSLVTKEIENIRLLLNKIQEPDVEEKLDDRLYKTMETKSQNYQNLLDNL